MYSTSEISDSVKFHISISNPSICESKRFGDIRNIHTILIGCCERKSTCETYLNVALVRERILPTERPPLVGEVSANFCGSSGVAWSAQRIPYSRNLGFLDRCGRIILKRILKT
jgi:hypothetical protein